MIIRHNPRKYKKPFNKRAFLFPIVWVGLKKSIDIQGSKEKLISLGTYPEVSLAQARARRDESRKQVADNIDPSQARKALKEP